MSQATKQMPVKGVVKTAREDLLATFDSSKLHECLDATEMKKNAMKQQMDSLKQEMDDTNMRANNLNKIRKLCDGEQVVIFNDCEKYLKEFAISQVRIWAGKHEVEDRYCFGSYVGSTQYFVNLDDGVITTYSIRSIEKMPYRWSKSWVGMTMQRIV